MEEIVITLAEMKDIQYLRKIHIEAIKTCSNDYSFKIISALTDEKRLPAREYNKHISNREIYKAVFFDEITGWIHLNKKNMEIQGLFIKPDFQRRGIGKILVNKIFEQYQDKKIILDSTLTAHEFYEKVGFRTVCRRYIVRNKVKVPVFYMGRE